MPRNAPDWVTLTDGESIVWRGGPSKIKLVQELFGEAVLVVVDLALFAVDPNSLLGTDVPWLRWIPLGVAAIGFVLGLVSYLRFRAVAYVITTDEVYHRHGLVSRSVKNLRLRAIQDTGFDQSALQRVLGIGDVHVSTAGEGGVEIVFTNVANPSKINGRITEQLDATAG